MAGVGLIMTVIIGGLAGWIASRVMAARQGLLANVLFGIIGALIANGLLQLIFGRTWAGLLGQLVVAIAGACLVLWVWQKIRARR